MFSIVNEQLSDALSTGQLGPALQQFGVSPAAVEAANKVNVYCICITVVIENVQN